MATSLKDIAPMCDDTVLKTKRVELVKRVVLKNVMPNVKPFLLYTQVDAIYAERGRDEKIRKLIDILQMRVIIGEYKSFNAFILSLAGTQPELFGDICGRAPTVAESDFCVKEGAQLIRRTIDNTKHCTDSELDEQISFQHEFIELLIVDKAAEEHSLGSYEGNLPHRYGIHLQEVQNKDRSISVLDVLGSEDKPYKKVSIYGRAGIGKSTSLQFLAKQWALGKWATGLTLLFLLQLRLIMTQVIAISTVELLSLYGLYNLKDLASSTPFMFWLKNSASRIIILIDGLDEIPGFAERIQSTPIIHDVLQKAHPADLCVNILRGDLLPGCTVISASRPFFGLSQLPADAKAEILGLTSAKVTEYVECRHPHHVKNIMSVLRNNPILLSVCGITFYCMLITRLLSEGVVILDEDVRTYTRLISFIIIQYCSRKFPDSSFIIDASSYFSKLSKLAFSGIFQIDENEGLAKLMFTEEDLIRANINQQDIEKMKKTGILHVTRNKIGRYESWTAEFFHLSAQELLAVAHLLSHPPFPDSILDQLFYSGQFNIALQFVFGLHFDKDNYWIGKIWSVVSPQFQKHDIKPVLSSNIDNHIREHCNETDELLKICQLIYEGQWEEKAKDVFCYIAPDGKLLIDFTKVTAIELLAVDFICKSSGYLNSIDVRNAHMDDTLVTVLLSSLCKHNAQDLAELHLVANSIGALGATAIADSLWTIDGESLRHLSLLKTLDISYNNIGDEGAQALGRMLADNVKLEELYVAGNEIGESGIKALAEGLSQNHRLNVLIVDYKNVDGSGVKALADMLQQNKCLEVLELASSELGDDGVKILAEGLHRNTTLTELVLDKNEIGDKGAAVISEVLRGTTSLQSLHMTDNQIGDSGAKALADSMASNMSLRFVDFSDQKCMGEECLGEAGAIAMAGMLHQNTGLQALRIHGNNIGNAGAIAILDKLQENTNLKTLGISHTNIGDDAAVSLAHMLERNDSITELYMNTNRIGNAGAIAISNALSRTSHVRSMSTAGKEIADDGAIAMGGIPHTNNSLTQLFMAENRISEDGAIALADMLRENTSLVKLYIVLNPIGDEGAKAIAGAFRSVENDEGDHSQYNTTLRELCIAGNLGTTATEALNNIKDYNLDLCIE